MFDPLVRYMGFVRENAPNAELLPEGDFDLDGLGDRYELANGFDPFTPGEELLDPDQDGLTNVDEFQSNTNPNDSDTDNDGESDFSDTNRPANVDDFLEVRLVTRDIGKVNNGNCAKCHTTRLRVGDFSLFSRKHGDFAERSFWFRKGTNYPIHLSKFVRNLPPPTQNIGTPSTTWQYTAGILPAVGAPAAFIVQDPQTKLGTNKPPSAFPTDATVSIGTLIVPKIDVTWTNMPGNLALDANTNAGGGLRIFPDSLSPSDLGPRNRLRVKVKTTPPLPGQVVRLKSFDVDDPSRHPHYAPADTDPNDILREQGDDNLGIPSAGQLAATSATLNTQGEALVDYAVTYQPGNNFRVAAVLDTLGAQTHLDQLQVLDASAPLYVTPDTNAIPGFVGGITPMLTTWRKLHLEFDTMAAPPASGPGANFFTGQINWFRLNHPSPGRSVVSVRYAFGLDGPELFQNGRLEVSGVGTFHITKSWSFIDLLGRMQTGLLLTNTPSGLQTNQSVKLYDDDDNYLTDNVVYRSLLTLQSPPLPALHHVGPCLATNAARFAAAYITLADANALGFSTATTIPFKRQAALSFFDVGNQELKGKDRSDFWAYTVVFGYEPGPSGDGDPDSEEGTLAITQKSLGGILHSHSAIYLETTRDEVFERVATGGFEVPGNTNALRAQYFDQIYATAAHEIGHAPAGGFSKPC